MNPLTIDFDMDGIAVDLLTYWLQQISFRYGVDMPDLEHIDNFDLRESTAFKGAFRDPDTLTAMLRQPGFFERPRPVQGAIPTLTQLHLDGHHLRAKTSALDTNGERGKLLWLSRFLPWLKRSDVIFAKPAQKHEHIADVHIEDHPTTLVEIKRAQPFALVVGIEYPYNRGCGGGPIPLAKDYRNTAAAWTEIYDRVCNYARMKERQS